MLSTPQVQGALKALESHEVTSEPLRRVMAELEDELQVFRGSRILWIDDMPGDIVDVRRLFRALGADVVPATSSSMAWNIVQGDRDFDVIITDIRRQHTGSDGQHVAGLAEGVDFIVKLRGDRAMDPVGQVPVLFYSGHASGHLAALTQPAARTHPEPETCREVDELIRKVVRCLAQARERPIACPVRKETSHPAAC